MVADIRGALRAAGVTGQVVGATPYIPRTVREVRHLEIQAWMRDHRRSGAPFAILDDMEDMGDLTPWLVRTERGVGLQEAHVGLVLRMLGEGPKDL